jgi:hypothetical protein
MSIHVRFNRIYRWLSKSKAHFPLGEFVCANSKIVGTDPTFSQRIFSLTNHIAKICFSLRFARTNCLVENGLIVTEHSRWSKNWFFYFYIFRKLNFLKCFSNFIPNRRVCYYWWLIKRFKASNVASAHSLWLLLKIAANHRHRKSNLYAVNLC